MCEKAAGGEKLRPKHPEGGLGRPQGRRRARRRSRGAGRSAGCDGAIGLFCAQKAAIGEKLRPKHPERGAWGGRSAGCDGATGLFCAQKAAISEKLRPKHPERGRGAAVRPAEGPQAQPRGRPQRGLRRRDGFVLRTKSGDQRKAAAKAP